MHSYIVRVYRRRGGREFSGTVEAVQAGGVADGRLPQAKPFASAADLLGLMQAGALPSAAAGGVPAAGPGAEGSQDSPGPEGP
jgi:hypothetical protein